MMKKSIRVFSVAAACLLALSLMQGCATKVKASTATNPAPSEAFSSYSRITVKPAVFKAGYKGSAAGLEKIQANLAKDLAPSLESWNQKADNGRSLTIEPIVEELEFTRGATRVFLGPLAGSSGVLMRVKITDADGKIVAIPEFFQRADAMAAGFLFGVHDNLMLTRVANLASAYIVTNYGRAQGGPTGADDKAIALK
ncbi:hypothetical protein [Undibacterium sp. Ren11W]|uniref:hypothetical protein n=1 Tax=Undibacterium sp. Ren11W TaxID=3413045 RepID=UPI003BF2B6F2